MLTGEQKRFFAEMGFVIVPNLIPSHRLEAMRRRIEELCERWDSEEARRVGAQQEAEAGNPIAVRTAATVRKFSGLTRYEPIFREQAMDETLTAIVAELIGTPLLLYDDQAMLKPPFVGSAKLPHQDNAYFRVEPADACVTCWMALDDATVENGCLHYIAGSHKWGLLPHRAIPGTPHLVPDLPDEVEWTPAPAKAGDVVIHHSLTVHFSPDNRSPFWRRSFICHYVRADAMMPQKDPTQLLLVRD
jgi:phytanoyl-CoA hydroxylase